MTREKALTLRAMIEKASESLEDADALKAIELYPAWKPNVHYYEGDRRRYGDKLYRVRQEHDSQAQYPPGIDTAALYEEVAANAEQGTRDNPIPYTGNMALEAGKYYSQDGITYLCFRDTVNPVYNALSELANLYVEEAT